MTEASSPLPGTPADVETPAVGSAAVEDDPRHPGALGRRLRRPVVGQLAGMAARFGDAIGRPLAVRRALGVPTGVRAGGDGTVRAPRWWRPTSSPEAESTQASDVAPSPPGAGRSVEGSRRGLPRVVRAVAQDPSRAPGGTSAAAVPQTVPMRLPNEVTAAGTMLTAIDRRRRSPGPPARPDSQGGPSGKAPGTGTAPDVTRRGTSAGSPDAVRRTTAARSGAVGSTTERVRVGPERGVPVPSAATAQLLAAGGQYVRRRRSAAEAVRAGRVTPSGVATSRAGETPRAVGTTAAVATTTAAGTAAARAGRWTTTARADGGRAGVVGRAPSSGGARGAAVGADGLGGATATAAPVGGGGHDIADAGSSAGLSGGTPVAEVAAAPMVRRTGSLAAAFGAQLLVAAAAGFVGGGIGGAAGQPLRRAVGAPVRLRVPGGAPTTAPRGYAGRQRGDSAASAIGSITTARPSAQPRAVPAAAAGAGAVPNGASSAAAAATVQPRDQGGRGPEVRRTAQPAHAGTVDPGAGRGVRPAAGGEVQAAAGAGRTLAAAGTRADDVRRVTADGGAPLRPAVAAHGQVDSAARGQVAGAQPGAAGLVPTLAAAAATAVAPRQVEAGVGQRRGSHVLGDRAERGHGVTARRWSGLPVAVDALAVRRATDGVLLTAAASAGRSVRAGGPMVVRHAVSTHEGVSVAAALAGAGAGRAVGDLRRTGAGAAGQNRAGRAAGATQQGAPALRYAAVPSGPAPVGVQRLGRPAPAYATVRRLLDPPPEVADEWTPGIAGAPRTGSGRARLAGHRPGASAFGGSRSAGGPASRGASASRGGGLAVGGHRALGVGTPQGGAPDGRRPVLGLHRGATAPVELPDVQGVTGRSVLPPRAAPGGHRATDAPGSGPGTPATDAVGAAVAAALARTAPGRGGGVGSAAVPARVAALLAAEASGAFSAPGAPAATGPSASGGGIGIAAADSTASTGGTSRDAAVGALPTGFSPSTGTFEGALMNAVPVSRTWADPADSADPDVQALSPQVLDELVDRVVERIEDRVVEELERRGHRRTSGVF